MSCTRGEASFWELAFGKRGAEELYNIAEDPGCLNNLAGDLEHAPAKAELAARLASALENQGDPRMAGQGDVFEAYPVATRWAGYYEKFMAGEIDVATWILPSDIDPAMD